MGFFVALRKSNWSKESRHKRGYGSGWDKIRLIVLKCDNGLCQCSKCQGGKIRVTPATEVDHIIPKAKGGTDRLDNLQSINKQCHKIKTAAEQGRNLKPKIQIGMDGLPILGAEA